MKKNISMKCLVCNKRIEQLMESDESESYDNLNQSMWCKASVDTITSGYGSKHDGDRYFIAICDKCLEEKFKQGVILYKDNYIVGKEKKKLEHSIKMNNRLSNLDDLLE